MRTIVVLCLLTIVAAQYNYYPQTAILAKVLANDVSGETILEDNLAQVAYKEFDKEFFSFSAPEGEFDDDLAAQKVANTLKRNLRVIFIRGPENSDLENAALQLAKKSADERTAIYVLNKQTDIGDLTSKLNAVNKNNFNKPEVHFVKYRTPTDAVNAQHAIQSQYDSLPGTSSSLNGRSAAVLDFASIAPAQLTGQIGSGPSNSFVPPYTSYLPPGRRT